MDAREVAHGSRGAVDALLRRIDREYGSLSPKLQSIAREIARTRSTLALDRIEDIASRCGVPPSALVRFARRFGFAGFRALRETFRIELRNREGHEGDWRPCRPNALAALLAARIDHTRAAFETWQRTIDHDAIGHAGELLARARRICIACTPATLAAALYCFHALLEWREAVELVTPMWPSSISGQREPEAGETWLVFDLGQGHREMRNLLEKLAKSDVPSVLITDHCEPALSESSRSVLAVAAAGGLDFDSLASTMTLCAALMATCRFYLPIEPSAHADVIE
jgi:DNA-binding MurR/RpiR family transcriptional regulator